MKIKEIVTTTVLILALITISTTTAAALTCDCGDICVNETGWWNNGSTFNASTTPIQAAVDNASSGDTICVEAGSYTENVDIATPHLTLAGAGADVVTVTAEDSGDHVFAVAAGYVNISGFNATGASSYPYAGIYLNGADHCNISDNTASNNYRGIYLDSSSNNTLTSNTADSNNYCGIYLYSTSDNTLESNNASNNDRGIYLYSESNNTLVNNTMSGNSYNFGVSGNSLSEYSQNIDTSNTVDGKPIYYWVDQKDKQIPNDAGFVGVVNGTNITVRDLTLTKNIQGVLFAYTENSRIGNVIASNNDRGIYLYSSSSNTLANNTANSNGFGIDLDSSSNNTLAGNTADSNNDVGIHLRQSSNYNRLMSNNASNNDRGIFLDSSSSNTLVNNTMSGNSYNFGVSCYSLSEYSQNIDTSNTVDGKPIYYWVDQKDKQIPNDAGFVGVVNGTNITVRDLTLTKNHRGVLFAYTENSRIGNVIASNNNLGIFLDYSSSNTLANNTANSNGFGILLFFSSDNTLASNNASNNEVGIGGYASSSNTLANNTANSNGLGILLFFSSDNTLASNTANSNELGIGLEFSSGNLIYNNYFNNTANAAADGNNQWTITKTAGTNIIDGPFLGGNYWSDYAGNDTDGDGLGDTLLPYNSSGGIQNGGDYHPLVVPCADTTPPDPVNLANTTGGGYFGYWVNYTWSAGTGNVTDSYNVSLNGTWTNGTTSTFMNVSMSPCEWANITVLAYNASCTGTLSEGSVSDEVQAPCDITPPNPVNLANTTGGGYPDYWVNYTWSAGTGNVTDSYNISLNGTWTNGTTSTFMNVSVNPCEWANITVLAYNASGAGTLSEGSVSDEVQAPCDTTPPVITITRPEPYGLYTEGMTLSFSATDDLSGVATVVGNLTNTSDVSQNVVGNSSFAPPVGVYTLVVTATDNASNTNVSDPVFFVVYDPDGGHATGGGWFYPDENSTTPDGKANFGFTARYKNDVSTGKLNFQYIDAGIHLKSTSIDWLTISAVSAQFQGTGTINGTGLYTFRVKAKDNGEPGVDVDHFDIKIWNGTDTEADPYHKAKNTISGGNIQVHTN